jgi:hypothetical protein
MPQSLRIYIFWFLIRFRRNIWQPLSEAYEDQTQRGAAWRQEFLI